MGRCGKDRCQSGRRSATARQAQVDKRQNSSPPCRHGRIEEVDAAVNVVAEILRGFPSIRMDERIGREVHHRVWSRMLHGVVDVAHSFADLPADPPLCDGLRSSCRKNSGTVPRVEQLLHADVADVSGTAGNEDFRLLMIDSCDWPAPLRAAPSARASLRRWNHALLLQLRHHHRHVPIFGNSGASSFCSWPWSPIRGSRLAHCAISSPAR